MPSMFSGNTESEYERFLRMMNASAQPQGYYGNGPYGFAPMSPGSQREVAGRVAWAQDVIPPAQESFGLPQQSAQPQQPRLAPAPVDARYGTNPYTGQAVVPSAPGQYPTESQYVVRPTQDQFGIPINNPEQYQAEVARLMFPPAGQQSQAQPQAQSGYTPNVLNFMIAEDQRKGRAPLPALPSQARAAQPQPTQGAPSGISSEDALNLFGVGAKQQSSFMGYDNEGRPVFRTQEQLGGQEEARARVAQARAEGRQADPRDLQMLGIGTQGMAPAAPSAPNRPLTPQERQYAAAQRGISGERPAFYGEQGGAVSQEEAQSFSDRNAQTQAEQAYARRIAAIQNAPGMTKEARARAVTAVENARTVAQKQAKADELAERAIAVQERRAGTEEAGVRAQREESANRLRIAELAAGTADTQAKWKAYSDYFSEAYKADKQFQSKIADITQKATEFGMTQQSAAQAQRLATMKWVFESLVSSGKNASSSASDLLKTFAGTDAATQKLLQTSGVFADMPSLIQRAASNGLDENSVNMLNSIMASLK